MKSTKRRSFKKAFGMVLITAGLTVIISLTLFTKFLRPRIISVSQSFAENEVSMVIDREIQRLMLEEFLSYDKIAIINRDSAGRVTSVSANSVLINNFANDLDIKIGEIIDDADRIEKGVYLSGLLGADLFAGIGPKIPIRFQPVSVTHADITHTFDEAGINQTLHTITLLISVDVEILLPMAHSTINVKSEMPIAQTLIVGMVPDAYFNKK
ncbi:MAG: sporulation protein YunB [Ruminococcaceae bacterium]|nr:sporulation protein YunB [Oscillospiraceae bacterium]